MRHGDRRLTYAELNAAAAAFAAHLASRGLERGDRVALFLRNGLPYPAALLGAFRGGYVVVPINAKLYPSEAAYIAENAEADAIVIDADVAHKFVAASRAPSFDQPCRWRWRPSAGGAPSRSARVSADGRL